MSRTETDQQVDLDLSKEKLSADLAGQIDLDAEIGCMYTGCPKTATVLGVLVHHEDEMACSPQALCGAHASLYQVMMRIGTFSCLDHGMDGTPVFYPL